MTKEGFFLNQSGCSYQTVSLITSCGPFLILFRNIAVPWIFSNRSFTNTVYDACLKFFVDFVLLVLPVILLFTVAADNVSLLLIYCFCFICVLFFFCICEYVYSDRVRPPWKEVFAFVPQINGPTVYHCVSYLRSFVFIASAVAILAVDFHIFPRVFAKTEVFGFSLMDTGVGMFIVSNAVVSPEARRIYWRLPVARLPRQILSCLPLVVIGFVRIVLVSLTAYDQPVGEYGIHWNFFFTLASVKILMSFLSCAMPLCLLAWPMGIGCACGYQYLLSEFEWREILLYGAARDMDRTSLFDANREGIVSTLGYFALYFCGIGIGRLVFRINRQTLKSQTLLLVRLIVISLLFFAFMRLSMQFIESPSRRMANLPYILWIVYLTLQTLCLFLVGEIVVNFMKAIRMPLYHSGDENDRSDPLLKLEPCLIKAVNFNGLVLFVIANVLTGLVNLTIDTESILNPYISLSILTGYSFLCCVFVYLMYTRRIRLKL